MVKKLLFFLFVFFIFLHNKSYSQTMYFCFNDGTSTSYSISDIRNINFLNQEINITEFSGSVFSKPLSLWSVANLTGCSNQLFVNDLEDDVNNFVIYPNPSNSGLSIESLNSIEGEVEIDFINLEGILLKRYTKQQTDGLNFSIKINSTEMGEIGLIAGVYICKISAINSTVFKKIIIQ